MINYLIRPETMFKCDAKHNEACRRPRPGYESAWAHFMSAVDSADTQGWARGLSLGLNEYRKAHNARYDWEDGGWLIEDFYIGPLVDEVANNRSHKDTLRALKGLLNGEIGRYSGAVLSRRINQAIDQA